MRETARECRRMRENARGNTKDWLKNTVKIRETVKMRANVENEKECDKCTWLSFIFISGIMIVIS